MKKTTLSQKNKSATDERLVLIEAKVPRSTIVLIENALYNNEAIKSVIRSMQDHSEKLIKSGSLRTTSPEERRAESVDPVNMYKSLSATKSPPKSFTDARDPFKTLDAEYEEDDRDSQSSHYPKTSRSRDSKTQALKATEPREKRFSVLNTGLSGKSDRDYSDMGQSSPEVSNERQMLSMPKSRSRRSPLQSDVEDTFGNIDIRRTNNSRNFSPKSYRSSLSVKPFTSISSTNFKTAQIDKIERSGHARNYQISSIAETRLPKVCFTCGYDLEMHQPVIARLEKMNVKWFDMFQYAIIIKALMRSGTNYHMLKDVDANLEVSWEYSNEPLLDELIDIISEWKETMEWNEIRQMIMTDFDIDVAAFTTDRLGHMYCCRANAMVATTFYRPGKNALAVNKIEDDEGIFDSSLPGLQSVASELHPVVRV